jgi:hypothetical protein
LIRLYLPPGALGACGANAFVGSWVTPLDIIEKSDKEKINA